MDGERREAIAAHHDRVFPDDLGAGRDLAQRDHPPGDRAPDLQAVDRADVFALGQRRTGDDRQQPRLLREDAGAGAARLAVEADHASFEAGLQRLGHLDARDAVAPGLEFEQVGADHLHPLAPVAADAHRAAIVLENVHRLIAELAQFRRIGAAEPRLDAPAVARAQEELLGDGVGVRVLLVQMFLNVGNQPVDLSRSHRHRRGTARRPGSPFSGE